MRHQLQLTLLLSALAIWLLGFSACRKGEQPVFTNAIVLDGGSVPADGCGWMIRVGDTDYSPTNLADQFKQTQLKVSIRYEILDSKFLCGWGRKITEIRLTEIRKR